MTAALALGLRSPLAGELPEVWLRRCKLVLPASKENTPPNLALEQGGNAPFFPLLASLGEVLGRTPLPWAMEGGLALSPL